MVKFLLVFMSVLISVGANSTDIFVCSISEEIVAEFNKGEWVKAEKNKGEGKISVNINNEVASVSFNDTYGERLETSCEFVGGTAGYSCKKIRKLTPHGEVFKINFYPYLKEMTVEAVISMRDVGAYLSEPKEGGSYFDGIRYRVKKSYGKCSKL